MKLMGDQVVNLWRWMRCETATWKNLRKGASHLKKGEPDDWLTVKACRCAVGWMWPADENGWKELLAPDCDGRTVRLSICEAKSLRDKGSSFLTELPLQLWWLHPAPADISLCPFHHSIANAMAAAQWAFCSSGLCWTQSSCWVMEHVSAVSWIEELECSVVSTAIKGEVSGSQDFCWRTEEIMQEIVSLRRA